jgi:steroid delta-isomerase-like uncharacterized protein
MALTIERAEQVARLYFDEAFNKGNLDVVDQILAADFELFVPPSLGDGPVLAGPEAFKQLVVGLRAAFGDLRFVVHDTAANATVAMVSWTMTGTHRAEWAGIPATGRHATLVGVDVFRFDEAGKIVEERIHGDYLGFLRELGAIPAEPAPGSAN